MVLHPGSAVSGYVVERVLGAGGMGTVYLARNPMLPRNDALKVLSSEFSQDPAFRTRFTREADLAAGLDHPNIVTVYTRGESDDGQLWIAMQYVPGTDASAEIRGGRMTPARAIHVVTEVARALDYAHGRNLLHRDVKPANFLLAPGPAGEPERVLLGDFGIARAMDETQGLTVTGMIIATLAYAAPETLNGGAIDERADVYSLGCALYGMLAGKPPFGGSGGMAVAAHLYQPVPRITDSVPALPAEMNDVFATAMAKDPDRRYQSARELARAAVAALHGHNVAPPPPDLPPLAPRSPSHRQPTTQRAAQIAPRPAPWPPPQYGGVAAVPVVGNVAQNRQLPPTPPSAHAPDPSHRSSSQGRRGRRGAWVVGALLAVVAVVAGTVLALTRTGAPDAPAYPPQSFVHTHGTTSIDTRPTRVAAMGPGDTAAVLSLGVEPVVIGSPNGELPSWEQSLIHGTPTVLGNLDVPAVAGAQPQVVIDTGNIDESTYAALARVAPTITRPPNLSDPQWTWQAQLDWIGTILGLKDKARQLTDASTIRQRDLRKQHPAFEGKTIEAINVTDTGITATLTGTNAERYLQGLGFRYSSALARTPDDPGAARVIPDPANLNQAPADVRLVVRTDAAADQGYNQLPAAFTDRNTNVTTIVVADPAVVSALATGGYAATEYLDTVFVETLAAHIH